MESSLKNVSVATESLTQASVRRQHFRAGGRLLWEVSGGQKRSARLELDFRHLYNKEGNLKIVKTTFKNENLDEL